MILMNMSGLGKVFRQYDVFLINLEPTIGSELQKTRPGVIISPNEMNKPLHTVIIAPLTTTLKKYPTRINLIFSRKKGQIVLDQLRTIDKSRLVKKLGAIKPAEQIQIQQIIAEMLCR